MPTPSALPIPFEELAWTRFEVSLRNVRNLESKSNPLGVFQALFKHACHAGFPADLPYGLTPLHPLPQRVALHGVYSFGVHMAGDRAEAALTLQKGLRAHLDGAGRNYVIETLSPPVLRTGANVRDGLTGGNDDEELCLEFTSPLPLSGEGECAQRRLTPEVFRELALARLRKYFGPGAAEPPAAPELVVLPHFLRSVRSLVRSKSNGETYPLSGLVGPLYLRGASAAWRPWLALLSEIQLSGRRGDAMGAFLLRTGRAALEAGLLNPSTYLESARNWSDHSDTGDEVVNALTDTGEVCQAITRDLRDKTYQPQPLRMHRFPKPGGGWRTVGTPAPRDRITQEGILRLIEKPCERMMEDASIGYRAGKSVRTARTAILAAIREGHEWAFESDIEAFFDQMDWGHLDQALAARFPRADDCLLGALRAFARAPLADAEGRLQPRTRGIPQGNPLSPLLANLYLDSFDEDMLRAGHRLIRYGDDFLVLAKTREGAEQAGRDAAKFLERVGLSLKPEKTAVRELGSRFRFLGLEIGPELDEETVEQAGLKAPLFVRQLFGMVGVDGDSVVVSRKGQMIVRIPMHRLSEVVVIGGNVVSARLVQRCGEMRIPVSFCTVSGWFVNTLIPPSRAAHGVAGRQAERRAALKEAEVLWLARRLIQAKVDNHLTWLAGRRVSPEARAELQDCLRSLEKQAGVEALRGAEGHAARMVFHLVNHLVEAPNFRSTARLPRVKPDRWNALLDCLYSLLFSRLNVLVRARGMNPYLGFLHSAESPYESLICDLQEPFRARMDRLAVKLVNRRQVVESDFEPQAQEGFRLSQEGFTKVIGAFEEELHQVTAGEPAPLHQLLIAQVLSIRHWIETGDEPRFYQAGA